jgi:HD superfamily phosphohydrolase
MIYVLNNKKEIHEPFYQTNISAYPWEIELLKSTSVRRLKFLTHYGTGSFISSAKHTRFEHTLGVWAIISTFFPKEEELRIAALLHDIGHLPFSHAVERTLGFNHHQITEDNINGEEVSKILLTHGFSPSMIIDLLNQDSPLSHKTPYLSADHLDSFLRDSYMLGKSKEHPSHTLRKISFNHQYVEADLQTSKNIMECIYYDHLCFLDPYSLALDSLLAKAISIFAQKKETSLESIKSLTNNELIQLLHSSDLPKVKEIMSIIMWAPEKIMIQDEEAKGTEKVEVKKVYDKTPLVDGVALTSICSESNRLLETIRSLKKSYYFTY